MGEKYDGIRFCSNHARRGVYLFIYFSSSPISLIILFDQLQLFKKWKAACSFRCYCYAATGCFSWWWDLVCCVYIILPLLISSPLLPYALSLFSPRYLLVHRCGRGSYSTICMLFKEDPALVHWPLLRYSVPSFNSYLSIPPIFHLLFAGPNFILFSIQDDLVWLSSSVFASHNIWREVPVLVGECLSHASLYCIPLVFFFVSSCSPSFLQNLITIR